MFDDLGRAVSLEQAAQLAESVFDRTGEALDPHQRARLGAPDSGWQMCGAGEFERGAECGAQGLYGAGIVEA